MHDIRKVDEHVACILCVTAIYHHRVLALVTAHRRQWCRLPYASDNCRLRRTQLRRRNSSVSSFWNSSVYCMACLWDLPLDSRTGY